MAGDELDLFGIGPLELLFIGAVALVVFGPDKLPEMARHVGRIAGEARRVTAELGGELQQAFTVDSPGTPRPSARSPRSPEPRQEAPGPTRDQESDRLVPPY